MALRKLRYENDNILRKKAKPVKDFNGKLHTLLDDMDETMKSLDGLGLAAPQIGILRRIVIVDVGDGVIELINPEIVEADGEQERVEGCLSIPGKRGIVSRPLNVTVKAQNRLGEEVIHTASELTALAFCHEIDHLDGILYTDKIIRMCEDDELIEEE